MKKSTETIKDSSGNVIAIVIYSSFFKEGSAFFTPADFSQQLGFISRKKGSTIGAHTHKKLKVNIKLTQETLFVRKGKVKVNLYDDKKKYIESKMLNRGDTILLASGGHGFEFLSDAELIEAKQGPYIDDSYKQMFKGIENI